MRQRDFNTEFLEIVCFNAEDDRDPIELAAADFRVVDAARYVLGCQVEGLKVSYDYNELKATIGGEYYLTEYEVAAAMDICERRIDN